MTKRPSCDTCLRPLRTCICKHIQTVENLVSVVILQHPLETHEVKNTGRLLHLCLKNSQIITGETFGEDCIRFFQNETFRDLLLYPSTPDDTSLVLRTTPTIELHQNEVATTPTNLKQLRLWVLDATWRKSRKMLYLNSFLQAMPRFSLDNCPSSLYTIRKAHSENQLSSLEASCYALQKLEANKVDYSPVMNAFTAFVAEQHTFFPSSK